MKLNRLCTIAAAMTGLLCVSLSFAQQQGDMRLGFLVMAGGRYDNLRMCVASPPDVKGGVIADIMVTGRYTLNDQLGIGFNVPVMRPGSVRAGLFHASI